MADVRDIPSPPDVPRTEAAGEVISEAPPLVGSRITGETYSGVLDRVLESVARENNEIEAQRTSAPELARELAALEPSRRQLLVQNSEKYKSWPLVECLLESCRRGWTEDPASAEDLAQLAFEVADSLRFSGFRARLLQDLKAQAWCYIANCRRIRSDLHESQRAFRNAEAHLRRGSGDSLENARFLDMKSSLLAEQRKFDAAGALLLSAIKAYRRAGERHLEGRALLKLAKFQREDGHVADAVGIMERAQMLFDPEVEPWLTFVAKKNLLSCFIDLGRTEEAQALLPEVRELARRHGYRLERLRLLWTEARLRLSLGQAELAEAALKQAREGFIAAGIAYDVALVSLDLAALYLDSGRTDEVRQLAVETMPIFASRNVQRDLVVAWQLFTKAADQDMATLQLLKEVASQIRSSDSSIAGIGSSS